MKTFDLNEKLYQDFVEQSLKDSELRKKCYFTDKDHLERDFIKTLSNEQQLEFVQLKLSYEGVQYRFSKELIQFVAQNLLVALAELYLGVSKNKHLKKLQKESTKKK